MRPIVRVVVALISLLRLGWSTRFRLGGAYWSWRRETAFGGDRSRWPSEAERRRAMIDYGAWVGAMRSLRRSRRLF
jgi:hypothetical protein